MRSPVLVALGLSAPACLALAACTADGVERGGRARAAAGDSARIASDLAAAPGGVIRRGDSFATMAAQYRPHVGMAIASGASAWVEPAPAPALVASGLPPAADPPAPPPAAVANRQPNAAPARPAVPASDIARPEAAAPEAAPAAASSPALRTAGLALFNNYSCGTCHAFADAAATGPVGPSLDNNPRLTKAHAVDVITNGQGPMPSFAGQMSAAEIATLSDYLVGFARK